LPDVGGCRQRDHPVERIEVVPSLLYERHPMTIIRSGHPATPPRARFWLLHRSAGTRSSARSGQRFELA
jgi:hypothetical protein